MIEKLPPAPWYADESWVTANPLNNGSVRDTPGFIKCEGYLRNAFVEFAVLARNALDVMVRRGWEPHLCMVASDGEKGWCVEDVVGGRIRPFPDGWWPDPFTALVEADKMRGTNDNKP